MPILRHRGHMRGTIGFVWGENLLVEEEGVVAKRLFQSGFLYVWKGETKVVGTSYVEVWAGKGWSGVIWGFLGGGVDEWVGGFVIFAAILRSLIMEIEGPERHRKGRRIHNLKLI